MASPLTSSARGSCSSEARRSQPRSARYIGYEKTAEIAKESVATGKPIRAIVLERGLIEPTELDRILSVEAMTRPGIAGEKR